MTGPTRLRGNTFLTLLLRAGVQELGQRPEWGENNNGITRANMFADLLKMTQPAYNPPKLKTLSSYFSKYLAGKMPRSPQYFDFDKAGIRYGLSTRINSEYQIVLAEMDVFCKRYLSKSLIDRYMLVGGLVDAIMQDITFKGSFDVSGNKFVDRTTLFNEKNFVLQPFLVSVWNEILMNHPDTSEGLDTYQKWTRDAGYNSPRTITTDIGKKRAKSITVSDQIPGGLIMKNLAEEKCNKNFEVECEHSDSVEIIKEVVEKNYDRQEQHDENKSSSNSSYNTSDSTPNTAQQQNVLNKSGRVFNQNANTIYNIENIGVFHAQ